MDNKPKHIISKTWWYQNKPDRRSWLVLSVLLFVCTPMAYIGFKYHFDSSILDKQWKSNYNNKKWRDFKKYDNRDKGNADLTLEKVNFKSLVEMGLSQKAAAIFLSLRKKGNLLDTWKKIDGMKAFEEHEKLIFKQNFKFKESPASPYGNERFEFDPNTVTPSELNAMGFTDWMVNNIMRFREKGGRFYKTDDFSKVYGLSPEKFQALRPYIIIRDFNEDDSENLRGGFVRKSKTTMQIDINTAQAIELQKIKGIGVYISENIVKYRQRLGGFVSVDQFSEVTNLADSVLTALKGNTTIGSSVTQIKINQLSFKEFKFHPYIQTKQMKILLNYRLQRNGLLAPSDLIDSKVFTEEEAKRITPYLDFTKQAKN